MNFDRLAPHYDWMERVSAGRLLQRARTTWLDALASRQRVLSAGEGHGRFAAAFTQRFPSASLTCVDASAGMLAVARRRADRLGAQPTLVHAALPQWSPPQERFDALVTHFFLDCFPPADLERVIATLARAATDDAVWLVTDFAIPDRGLRHWRARAAHAAMYAFFRTAVSLPARQLTPPDDMLRAHGFRLAGRRDLSLGLVRADLWHR